MAAKKKTGTKAKKGGARRKSSGTKSHLMDKAKLGLGLLATATAITMADRYREGKTLNPFSKVYWTT